ncbi:hypothetical protein NC652_026532 [Populus alba x Populus x berolinensis]|nr:hypothetical protein NC652_026532 [Populus alba x Populus x berolinensis]
MEERGLHLLCWPFTVTEIEEIKSNFEKIFGLPNYCVDRSNGVWIDREKNHNMLVQATGDPNMRSCGVIVGFPGSLSYALLLQNSSFHKLSKEVKMLNEKKIELQGVELGKYKSGTQAEGNVEDNSWGNVAAW